MVFVLICFVLDSGLVVYWFALLWFVLFDFEVGFVSLIVLLRVEFGGRYLLVV